MRFKMQKFAEEGPEMSCVWTNKTVGLCRKSRVASCSLLSQIGDGERCMKVSFVAQVVLRVGHFLDTLAMLLDCPASFFNYGSSGKFTKSMRRLDSGPAGWPSPLAFRFAMPLLLK